MRSFRLLRGTVLTAITWGVAWAVLGMAISLPSVLRDFSMGREVVPLALLFALPIFYGVVGVWTGTVFAITMSLSERRRTFSELSMARVITWGVVGGISYPLVAFGVSLTSDVERSGLGVAIGITGAFGALCAWATLRSARRASAAPAQRSTDDRSLELASDTHTELPHELDQALNVDRRTAAARVSRAP